MSRDLRFEQQLPTALEDLASTRYPAYVDEVLAITARTARRPAWRFPSRWLPLAPWFGSVAGRRIADLRPLATVLVVLLAILLLAVAIAIVGTQRRLPAPFGLAGNGLIAFSAGGGVHVVDVDGTSRLLFDGPGDEVGLTYSLDGTRIAFIRLLGGREYLWAANADGTGEIQLLPNAVQDPSGLVWSPDGSRIAIGFLVDGIDRIVLVDADGSGSSVLDLPFPARDPAWRPPDGRELVVRGRDGDRHQLFVVAADGSAVRSLGLRPLGLLGGSYDLLGAAWSPDGSRVAYHTVDDPPDVTIGRRFQVHVVNADGTDDHVLSSHPDGSVQEAWPVWSPDGTQIATQRWRESGTAWAAVVPADGIGRPVDAGLETSFEAFMGWSATWSPDGTRLIAFWDAEVGAISIDPRTGDYEPIDWPLTDRPSWQRVAP
jgi:hypothetical protein